MVRYLTEKDYSIVLEIEKEAVFAVSEMLDDPEYALGVFDSNGKLCGFCSCGSADIFGDEYLEDIALSDLYILNSERHKKYASELIYKIIEICKERKCNLILDLWEDDLQSFYEQFGFVKNSFNTMIFNQK